MRPFLFTLLFGLAAPAQDPGRLLVEQILEDTRGRVKVSFEERVRLETRTNVGLARDADTENPLLRMRIGVEIQATSWMKFAATGQDARAPLYGRPAPSNLRDPMDLHQMYVELFGNRKTGFGATAGRHMFGYGEQRIIGVPDWGNTARTFDAARLYYRWPGVRLEAVFASVTPVRPEAFNRPVLRDHFWGTYNQFGRVDAYVLRRQFAEGATTTVGARTATPIGAGFQLSIEGAAQGGSINSLDHSAFAWHSTLTRRVTIGKPVELTIEYNYASGSDEPQRRSHTFDQLHGANHDKYGHADLFGWRNIHHLRSLDTITFGKLSLRFMYSNFWLASPRDALYNLQGRPIVRSPDGTAGRHVGQEADLYATFPWRSFIWGVGYAHFFAGEFVRKMAPGVNPSYAYFFQTYRF